MLNIYIKSIGYYIPSGKMSNDEILKQVENVNRDRFNRDDLDFLIYSCKRKFEFLGIKERSYCTENDNAVSMAKKASLNAIERAHLRPEEIECIIFSGVNNPFREPSFAMIVANQMGLNNGDFFDINDTCNGFLKSIEIAYFYLKDQRYKNILLITSENPYEVGRSFGETFGIEKLEDMDNKFSALYAGSAAGAIILSNEGSKGKITHYIEQRQTQDWDSSLYTAPNTCLPKTKYKKILNGVWADPRRISSLIIEEMPVFIKNELKKIGIQIDSIDLFFTHQLGDNVTFATLDKLNIDRQKAPINTFKEYGNLAAANIPVNMAKALEAGIIRDGSSILLMSSACGLTYSIAHVLW